MQNYKNPIFRKAVEALETLMVDSNVMVAQSAIDRERLKPEIFDAKETERQLKWQEQYKHILHYELPALQEEAERVNEAKRAAALNMDDCEKEIFLLNNSDSLSAKDLYLLAKKHPDKHLFLSALVKYAESHEIDARAPEIVQISTLATQARPSFLVDHGGFLSMFNRHLNRMHGYESAAAELSIYQKIDAAGCFTDTEQRYFCE